MTLTSTFLGCGAVAFALVASMTGVWGAAVWAAVLSPLASTAAVLEARDAPESGGGVA